MSGRAQSPTEDSKRPRQIQYRCSIVAGENGRLGGLKEHKIKLGLIARL